ncbi:unnamed protein product [Chironomus riparius]|uniref:UDP-glucuronosyltransferase n=1 Tax=Chironomus riparius TaxID=315576 RepID=A0A9N9RXQ1_9DIPT|nr:unnamed protein product [Chironomus riparius]
MKIVGLLFAVLSILIGIDGLKILAFLPFGSKSHFAIGHSIAKTLADAGHEVTAVSPYPVKKPIKNYKDISTEDYLKVFFKENAANMFKYENSGAIAKIIEVFVIHWMGTEIVEFHVKHPKILELLNSNEKFDVCLVEVFNFDAVSLGVAEHFGCEIVSYMTYAAVKWADDMTGNLSPTSYVPKPYLEYTDKMNFKQRLSNTVYTHIEDLIYEFIIKSNQRKLYNKYFPNAKSTFDEVYKKSAIYFLNTHVAYSTVRPYLPNLVEIGGIHVQQAKPLPKDIQEYLDSATEGAIVFSMGSLIKSSEWPVEKREAFVRSFGKLKQKIIWKYEAADLPNKPDNVMISPWVPQRDIMAHPNVKLFITHGGLLGTTEALIEGIPVLGLPIFGDQKMNMAKAVSREYGQQIYFNDITEENLDHALNELINNPKYYENAKIISKRFNDRPMTPQESVVYWTEYAHRHKGAQHLKAASLELNFFEFRSIDVYAVLLLIALVNFYIDYLVLKWILRKIFGKSKKVENKKQKKQ